MPRNDKDTDAGNCESSPLLNKGQQSNSKLLSSDISARFPALVLAELIGARHLLVADNQASDLEPYCVVQFGSKTLHITKPLMESTKISSSIHDPIWSIKESPLFIVSILPNDIINNKQLVITIWNRRSAGKLKVSKPQTDFCGKIRLKASAVVASCTEDRLEFNLIDDLGRKIKGADDKDPLLALRFRVASEADLRFVQAWNQATDAKSTVIPRTVLDGTGVHPHEHRPRANLVTSLEDVELSEFNLRAAFSASLSSAVPKGMVRVKPCPDPDETLRTTYMTRQQVKATTKLPSKHWIEAGSGNLGRLYLEILSCHGLPNVDIGDALGNRTDAFVTAVYGDAMADTSVIDDELNPHWPPWTQRAFILRMMHPSQVLFIAVFGYKRGLLSHVPIGRVEINPSNLQRDTEYHLSYSLFESSHVTDRKSQGTIRIRLRIEMNSERAALMAALRPCPEIYVNVRKKKALRVARYTCCGEYDNEEKFSLRVLLSYIDELKDKYLRRILYSVNDGGQSIIFWRGQVKVGPLWLPLHSFSLFCVSILLVERPLMAPALICLSVAWFMLVNMHLRLQSPSPWHRCSSFGHYFRILLLGSSLPAYEKVNSGDGWEEQKKIQDAFKERREVDDRFFEKKEAVEKELEAVEGISLETKSKAAIIPVELLVILGKVQGIVGNICRLCRLIDSIITWEESVVSFWVTIVFLIVGVIFLFMPWGFLFQWIFRITVVLLLGPQNRLLDMYLKRQSTDEHKLRKLFAARLFVARCHQEEAGKLKAFLHVLYGKYSTAVPTLMWTPHQDRPLPESEARVVDKSLDTLVCDDLPYIPGQKVYGLMIPRPHDEWVDNREESNVGKARMDAALSMVEKTAPNEVKSFEFKKNKSSEDEGFEVIDGYDEEAVIANNTQESLQGDWGEEVVEIYAEEAQFVQQSFRVRDEQRLTQENKSGMNLRGDFGGVVREANNSDEARLVEKNGQVQANSVALSDERAGLPTIITAELSKESGPGESSRGDEEALHIVAYAPQFIRKWLSKNDDADKAHLVPATRTNNRVARQESLRGDWGIEIAETFDEEARFIQQTCLEPVNEIPCIEHASSNSKASNVNGENHGKPTNDIRTYGHITEEAASTLCIDDLVVDCDELNLVGDPRSLEEARGPTSYSMNTESVAASENASAPISIAPAEGFEPASKATFPHETGAPPFGNPPVELGETSEELGVEITDMFDEEAMFVEHSCSVDMEDREP